MVLAGIALIIAGGDVGEGAGIVLVGGAGLVWLLNAFLRLSFSEQADRDREERAREFFDHHGRWPDDPGR
jgi:hypothetical protein